MEWRVAAWSHVTGEFAIGTNYGVYVYNPDTMQMTAYLDNIGQAIAFSPTQPLLAAFSPPDQVTIRDSITGNKEHTLHVALASNQFMFSIAFSPDGKVLATGTKDGLIELWDTNSGNKIRELNYHSGMMTNSVFHLVFKPDGKYLISEIYLVIVFWDAATGQLLNDSFSTLAFAEDIDLTADGQYLALVSENKISIWDVSKGGLKIPVPNTKVYEINGFSLFNDLVTQIVFDHQNDMLIAGSDKGELGAWSLTSNKKLFLQKGHNYSIDCLALSDDGRTLITASNDGSVILWGVTP